MVASQVALFIFLALEDLPEAGEHCPADEDNWNYQNGNQVCFPFTDMIAVRHFLAFTWLDDGDVKPGQPLRGVCAIQIRSGHCVEEAVSRANHRSTDTCGSSPVKFLLFGRPYKLT